MVVGTGEGEVWTTSEGLAHDPANGWTFDPSEWIAGEKGLIARCEQGRFDSLVDASTPTGRRKGQCRYPALRGSKRCVDHGGVQVAKQRLADSAVLMTEALIEIALDPEEKTTDRLSAINSGLDRAGGLGRTVAQPEPEVRSQLLARLEAAYHAAQEQALARLDSDAEADGGAGVVAAQELVEGPVGEAMVAVQSGGQEPPELDPSRARAHEESLLASSAPEEAVVAVQSVGQEREPSPWE